MADGPTLVLDHDQVRRKLERIAHQLHEEHHREDALVLVGISGRGSKLAARLATLLEGIATFRTEVLELTLDKDAPHAHPIRLSAPPERLAGRTVVLVDDVLMSGRTLMHAAAHLVQAPLKRLTTVVLVDRRHRAFPIRADIVGLTLSTTLQEHISVELGKRDRVQLT
ncbi:MAG: phosphoribosyltransferase [Flavobacteriales bacterium]|nr:Bifunctional protein PyrR [Flavobacteriales bacterium]MCC6575971.1 phosphoribosyltransferase [Flavobacteriales bacterium]NUQ16770.1 phosphoribosyltransferase [Flavobacteriales bacterium]